MQRLFGCSFAKVAAGILGLVCTLSAQSKDPASPDYFEAEIRPVLVEKCYACHTDSKLGGLRLDSREAALKGGKRGPAIVPGDPDKSLLVTSVRQTSADLKMPMGGKLSAAEISHLEAWVKAGAVWPEAKAPIEPAAGTETAAAEGPGSDAFFEAKIQPIFSGNCYACHTDGHASGLRLDSREAVLKGGRRGPAIVPGDPDKSLLITAVRQTDEHLKMPKGGKLTDVEVADLVAWVKAGAVWPKTAEPNVNSATHLEKYRISPERRKFWSFLPLQDPKPPQVKDARWSKTNIDRFVYAKLEKEALKPVGPANKLDLIRRATLDLTGLPPTPEEISAFENDKSPDAFAKVVDRLLASPHYGERWGRIWLDVARYGEDDYRSLNPRPRGYFPYKNPYLYRDWVIRALNDDLPYDMFVKAQLAGDLLDESVRYKMLPATGFLGLGPWYFDNGSVEVTRADERHDRVDVVSRGFLGLTVACARCHDHKYDPIPQTDYYALAGVFLNTDYHEYPRAPKAVVEAYLKQQDEIEKQEGALREMQSNLSEQLANTVALQSANYVQGVWEVTGPEKKNKASVVESRKLDYELLERWIDYMAKTTTRYHDKEPWQAMMKKGGNKKEAQKLAEAFQKKILELMVLKRQLDAENQIITDQANPGTKPKKRANKPNEFKTNDDFCPGCGLRLKVMSDEQNSFYTELFQRQLDDDQDADAMMQGMRGKPGVFSFRGWGLESRIGAEQRQQIQALEKNIEAMRKKSKEYEFVHGVRDVDHPVDLELALRGNPETLGPKVPRHFLSIFSQGEPKPFEHGSGRLQLAEDIIKQPIAMRVIVNRVWKGHFGTGIVDTPSNFGMGGERPTDPELLEYLASDFVRNGMSIKKLHREIMLSQVYQLSTEENATNLAKDSGNRFYWRANRKRLDAEQLRDSVLMVAGNLDPAIGGPSETLEPASTRRTVYGKVSRYRLDKYLQTFDFPAPNISAEKRFTTTVPLQRLFLMNSDFMQLEAEQLSKRVSDAPNNRARIRRAYLLAYGREPDEQELKLGLDYLHNEPLREYAERKKEAEKKGPGGRRRKGGKDDAALLSSTATSGGETQGPLNPPGDGAAGGEAPAPAGAAAMEDPNAGMGMGMMAGVPGMAGRRGANGGGPKPVSYEPTAWGRYVKILLSSSEFLFIN